MNASPRKFHRELTFSSTQARRTHSVHVRVAALADGGARCVDEHGAPYVIDQRSDIGLDTLAEGMELDVLAYPSGLVKSRVERR